MIYQGADSHRVSLGFQCLSNYGCMFMNGMTRDNDSTTWMPPRTKATWAPITSITRRRGLPN